MKELNTRHSTHLVTTLNSSFDSRFCAILEECLYICGAVLDHRFKLSWSNNEEKHKKIFLEDADKLDQRVESDSSSTSDEEPGPKKSKLFSYTVVPHCIHSKRKKNCE